jgi:hypothetical protein
MFASRTLPDVVSFIDDGIPYGAIATGTTSGSAILMPGPAPWRKLGVLLGMNSALGVSPALAIYTATASGGTFASFSARSNGNPCSQSIAPSSAGKWFLYTELRGECLTDLATGGYWIKVVVVGGVTGGTSVFGFNDGFEPAQMFNQCAGVGINLLM